MPGSGDIVDEPALAAQQRPILEALDIGSDDARHDDCTRPEPRRRPKRRPDDAVIARAAAEIAGNRQPNVVFAGIGIHRQQLDESEHHSRRAEAALQAVLVGHRLLDRMQTIGRRGDALDRGEFVAMRLHGEHETGAHRAPVEQNRAGAADPVLAADMGAGQPQLVAEEIGEAHPHRRRRAGRRAR